MYLVLRLTRFNELSYIAYAAVPCGQLGHVTRIEAFRPDRNLEGLYVSQKAIETSDSGFDCNPGPHDFLGGLRRI